MMPKLYHTVFIILINTFVYIFVTMTIEISGLFVKKKTRWVITDYDLINKYTVDGRD